jgi:hypothetical protein
MTKMTDAFKKVFLGLGGDPKKLAENNDVGDYIVDLESAIKEYVNEAATHELPTPEVEDIGKIVSVVSDGDEGAEYGFIDAPTSVVNISYTLTDSTIKIGSWRQEFSDLYDLARNENNHVRLRYEVGRIAEHSVLNIQYLELIHIYKYDDSKTLVFAGIVYDATTSTYKRATAVFTDSKTGTYTETALT